MPLRQYFMQYMIEEDCNCDEYYSAVSEDFEQENLCVGVVQEKQSLSDFM